MPNILQYTSTLRVIDATATQVGDVVRILYSEPTPPPPTPPPTDGSIDIILYNNKAETQRVNKTDFLTQITTIKGTLRNECSLITPVITLQMDSVPAFNYMYIPLFKRYYFVTDITSVRYGLWEINLEIDVLMTYSNSIRNLKAFIDRNEFTYNNMIPDDNRIFTPEVEEYYYDITDNFSIFRNNFDITDDDIANCCYILNGYSLSVSV